LCTRSGGLKLTTLEQFCLWSNEIQKDFPSIYSFAHSTNGVQSGSAKCKDLAVSSPTPHERGRIQVSKTSEN
jgi:hypothetical protein